MKTLHQFNRDGEHMETLCGLMLTQDIRDRDDMLLATLDVNQEDLVLNFGSDAIICSGCQGKVPEECDECDDEDEDDEILDA